MPKPIREIDDDVKRILGGKSKATRAQNRYTRRKGSWDKQAKLLYDLLCKELDPLEQYGCLIRYKSVRVKTFQSIVRTAYAKYATRRLNVPKSSRKFNWETAVELLGDVIGARVVCLNLSDVIRVVRRILSIEQFAWKRGDIKNFYEKARASRYRTWQVQLEWRTSSTPVRIEIQVRSILEDAWSEWEHELFYKRPPSLSFAAWDSLRLLHDKEKKQIADSLFEAAKTLDRVRDVFDITSRPLPEYITSDIAKRKYGPLEQSICDVIAKDPFRIDIRAANLTTGLQMEQLVVDWKGKRFFGLRLQPEVQTEERMRQAQRFAFDELYEQQTNGQTRIQLCFDGYDLPTEKVSDLDKCFSRKAQDLLMACYSHKMAVAHRTFFNEYQARLDEFMCSDGKHLDTQELLLQISRTNFAFEICTTYVLDEKRVIVRQPNGEEHPNVKNLKDALRPEVYNLEKTLCSASKTPNDRRRYAANPIGVHVNLISCERSGKERCEKQLIVMRRGREAALQQHEWSTSVSGVMVPLKESIESAGDIPGLAFGFETDTPIDDTPPSIFRAVQRELEEELAVHVPIDHIRVIALLFDQITGQPLIVAEAYSALTQQDIEKRRGIASERWEINRLCRVPLTEEGLGELFANTIVVKPDVVNTKEIRLPPLNRTVLNADIGQEMWGMRNAAAVLLTFCRHVGSRAVAKHLRTASVFEKKRDKKV